MTMYLTGKPSKTPTVLDMLSELDSKPSKKTTWEQVEKETDEVADIFKAKR